jgi:hypothetical protein
MVLGDPVSCVNVVLSPYPRDQDPYCSFLFCWYVGGFSLRKG